MLSSNKQSLTKCELEIGLNLKAPPTPAAMLLEAAEAALGVVATPKLLAEVPHRWEMHGDLVLLPPTAFVSDEWNSVPELWPTVARALGAQRVARKAPVNSKDPATRYKAQLTPWRLALDGYQCFLRRDPPSSTPLPLPSPFR